MSINEVVKEKVQQIEKLFEAEIEPKTVLQRIKKRKFTDRYTSVTISMRPEIREIIDLICEETKLNKCNVLSIILLNGIKNTDFSF